MAVVSQGQGQGWAMVGKGGQGRDGGAAAASNKLARSIFLISPTLPLSALPASFSPTEDYIMDFDEIPNAADDEQQFAPPPAIPENNLTYDSVYASNDDNILPDPEPQEDALTKFLKEWGKKLDAKRAAEYEHEKNTRTKAAEDLGNWKQQRDIRLTAKKDKNRSEEQVLLETLESEVEVLKVWERVTKLIDSNEVVPSELKGSDTSRMRKLFIQLKNEPLEVTRGNAVAAK